MIPMARRRKSRFQLILGAITLGIFMAAWMIGPTMLAKLIGGW